jgi:hypothetical protein
MAGPTSKPDQVPSPFDEAALEMALRHAGGATRTAQIAAHCRRAARPEQQGSRARSRRSMSPTSARWRWTAPWDQAATRAGRWPRLCGDADLILIGREYRRIRR